MVPLPLAACGVARDGTLTFGLRHVRGDAKARTCDQDPRLRSEAATETATTEPGIAWGGRDWDGKAVSSDAGWVWSDVGRATGCRIAIGFAA